MYCGASRFVAWPLGEKPSPFGYHLITVAP
jgi:hypothetical protein